MSPELVELYDTLTGISRYRKSGRVRSEREHGGLQGVDGLQRDLVAGGRRRCPGARYSGLNATVSSAPS